MDTYAIHKWTILKPIYEDVKKKVCFLKLTLVNESGNTISLLLYFEDATPLQAICNQIEKYFKGEEVYRGEYADNGEEFSIRNYIG